MEVQCRALNQQHPLNSNSSDLPLSNQMPPSENGYSSAVSFTERGVVSELPRLFGIKHHTFKQKGLWELEILFGKASRRFLLRINVMLILVKQIPRLWPSPAIFPSPTFFSRHTDCYLYGKGG